MAALAHGPAIVGLTYRFADPAIERRFVTSIMPQGQRRLVSLCVVAILICLVRLAAPLAGLTLSPESVFNVVPRCVTISTCLVTLACLRWIRTPRTLEILGCAFGLSYIATRCWLLTHMGPDGSAAMLVGTVALLVFGLPVRLAVLCPAMLAASLVMLSVWLRTSPPPSQVALFQVLMWLVVVNMLGTAALRMMRLTLRRQYALGCALRHMATHDGLTGIANRRLYDQCLERHWVRCRDEECPLSLVVLDVDFFKLLNDGIGHAAGDECLKDLAALLVGCVAHPTGLVARTGGEEFACVLPEASPLQARRVAEGIAAALRAREMAHPHSPIGPHITVSLGVATAFPADGLTLRDLTGLADRLVYDAKAAGRACLRQQVLGGAASGKAAGWSAEPLKLSA